MGATVVEGQVNGLQDGAEPGLRNQNQTVWTFRVERFDEVGNRVGLVPVELRGLKVEGSLSDGDRVRVTGSLRVGRCGRSAWRTSPPGANVRAPKPFPADASWLIGVP